jgi:hypothetical protein
LNTADAWAIVWGLIKALTSSSVFILALFIGFCVVVGFLKLKKSTGDAAVVRNLDDRISREPMTYLPPTAPRGPADQLRSPELVEAAARK